MLCHQNPFAIVFRFTGTVWPQVLPYCVLNCAVLTSLALVKHRLGVRISIMPQGHALMSLLIAYLGVSKVNLAYARYIDAQVATGHAFMTLRELHQLALTLTQGYASAEAEAWRADSRGTIVQLIHETVATLRDGRHAVLLARDVPETRGLESAEAGGSHDPMMLVHALRSHLYHESLALSRKEGDGAEELQLLERAKMLDLLHEFAISYRNLLRLASSPMPFALVQMGRTFTFVWTLTIPFVLSGKDFVQEYPSAFSFVVLLTYGFLGLEFVGRMLSNPFGDEIRNDLNVRGMGAAAVVGIENDARQWRDEFRRRSGANGGKDGAQRPSLSSTSGSGSIRRLVQVRQDSIRSAGRHVILGGSSRTLDYDGTSYRSMGDANNKTAGHPYIFL